MAGLECAPNPSWMGYSVGHWDGDTLVVESFGFNDRTWLDHDGHPHTEGLRTTERCRRRNFGNLEVEVTFSDPGAYAKPWTVAVRAELAADTEVIEWVCNEGNRGLEHWVGKASDERKGEVQVAAEILAKYVGTYEEQRPYWRAAARIVEITLSDGKLLADRTVEARFRSLPRPIHPFQASMASALSSFKAAPADFSSNTSPATTGSHESNIESVAVTRQSAAHRF
jgi:hypothetical protein